MTEAGAVLLAVSVVATLACVPVLGLRRPTRVLRRSDPPDPEDRRVRVRRIATADRRRFRFRRHRGVERRVGERRSGADPRRQRP